MQPFKNVNSLKSDMTNFIEKATQLLGKEQVISDPKLVAALVENTLAFKRISPAVIYPSTTEEIQTLVNWAKEHSIALYPVSKGFNVGYGDMTPSGSGQVVVNLERMNQILDYDEDGGAIEIQPGVTQQKLYEYLKTKGDIWFADVTGASTQASVVGNYLDGGFGHTPLGNHREHILELEVVLGSGAIFRTGRFPGTGPNLAPLFVQSNFGIVTSLRLPLLKTTEEVHTFTLHFKSEADFIAAIPELRKLKQEGAMPSLVHVANAPRILMSSLGLTQQPEHQQVLTEEDCLVQLRSPFIKATPWMGVGGVYGTHEQVKSTKKILKKKLKKYAQLTFFDDKKISKLQKIVKMLFWLKPTEKERIKNSLSSLQSIHNLCRGVPSDLPSQKVLWKCKNKKDLGLFWIGPTFPAKSEQFQQMLEVLRHNFKKFQFEMPMTITFVDQFQCVAILSINFDKSSPAQCERAQAAYAAVLEDLYLHGFRLYRKNILPVGEQIPSERKEAILALKKAFDEAGIIAPGRYGIAPEGENL